MTTYPEINALGLNDLRQAIALGETNLNGLTGAARLETVSRLNAMYDRLRRLYHTEQSIARADRRK